MKKLRKPKRWPKILKKQSKLNKIKRLTSKIPSSNTRMRNQLLTKKLNWLFKSILRPQKRKKLNFRSKWSSINSSKNKLRKIKMIISNKSHNLNNSLMITKLLLPNTRKKVKSLNSKYKKLGTTLKTLKLNTRNKSHP